MAISPKQFIATTEFHQRNLQEMLAMYVELPEAPGILACMLYMQKSMNAARAAAEEDEKNKQKEEENEH